MKVLRPYGIVKITAICVFVLIGVLIAFRKPIMEHKITKAKLELFKKMAESPPREWDEAVKAAYDSLTTAKKDTLSGPSIHE